MRRLNQLLDDLVEDTDDTKNLTDLFMARHDVFVWMRDICYYLLDLPLQQRQRLVQIEDVLDPKFMLKLYIEWFYEPSKPKLKEVK